MGHCWWNLPKACPLATRKAVCGEVSNKRHKATELPFGILGEAAGLCVLLATTLCRIWVSMGKAVRWGLASEESPERQLSPVMPLRCPLLTLDSRPAECPGDHFHRAGWPAGLCLSGSECLLKQGAASALVGAEHGVSGTLSPVSSGPSGEGGGMASLCSPRGVECVQSKGSILQGCCLPGLREGWREQASLGADVSACTNSSRLQAALVPRLA